MNVYFAVGGGIGDCWWDFLHEPEFRKLYGLVENYNAHVRAIVQCHCAGAEDVFAHNKYVHEVVCEAWRLPNAEDSHRLNQPLDGYVPINRNDLLYHHGVRQINTRPNELRLNDEEQLVVARLLDRKPAIVLQPYAGLSDRDAFDPASIQRLCEALIYLNSNVNILIVGKNHERGHKYSTEEVHFTHPCVTNLIDQLGIRVAHHLVSGCSAFCGAHSNLIRAAWDRRRRTALVVPSPLMTDHLPTMDAKYTYGMRFDESRLFTYEFTHGTERKFWTLDCENIARFLLYG